MMSLFPSMCAENLKIDLKALLKGLSVRNYRNNHMYYREFCILNHIVTSRSVTFLYRYIILLFTITILFRINSQQSDVEEEKKASD